MLKEYDFVRAKHDINTLIPKGTKGAIVLLLHENPNKYEVEFVDNNGETIELLTVGDEDLELAVN